MKILQICPRVPWPLTDGGNIAMNGLASLLERSGIEVTVFALNTKKHRINEDRLPESLRIRQSIVTYPIDTSIRIKDAALNFFRKDESYNVVRFFDKGAEEALASLLSLKKFDVIILESLFTTPYIPVIRKTCNSAVLLRAHNVEQVIWKSLADGTGNPLRRFYLNFLAGRIKNIEDRMGEMVDGFLPITDIDARYYESIAAYAKHFTLPLTIDTDKFHSQINTNEPLRLFHLGSMDWMPNVEAVEWFLDNCWENIGKHFPSLELHLAGRSFPERLVRKDAGNIHFAGTVDDSLSYMKDKQIMIVPLLSGSGMRVKILQGMALGKTIISTSTGSEGIPATDGKDILIADDEHAFLEKTEACMKDPEMAYRIGEQARLMVCEKFSETSIGPKLVGFLKSIAKPISYQA
ncbi:MAG: glycosyltransferase family 4 protein [Bacteroidota bacterium]